MNTTALLLIIVSAFTHAGWNLVGKYERPSLAFFFLATIIGTLCLSPWVITHIDVLGLFPPAVWLPLSVGGLFQCLYYTFLSRAYRSGELSVVYPIARALPLAFVAVGSFLLGRGGAISPSCLWGGALIMAGCFVLPQARLGEIRLAHYINPTSLLALLVALCTVAYSLADDYAIRYIAPLAGETISSFQLSLIYLLVQNLISIAFMFPMVMGRATGRRRISEILTHRLKNTAITGIGISGTYSLVLTAMSFASDITYVVAFRQLSIPLGTLMGVLLLKEKVTGPKILGMTILCFGLILVARG